MVVNGELRSMQGFVIDYQKGGRPIGDIVVIVETDAQLTEDPSQHLTEKTLTFRTSHVSGGVRISYPLFNSRDVDELRWKHGINDPRDFR
jgi:hypothetical protein